MLPVHAIQTAFRLHAAWVANTLKFQIELDNVDEEEGREPDFSELLSLAKGTQCRTSRQVQRPLEASGFRTAIA